MTKAEFIEMAELLQGTVQREEGHKSYWSAQYDLIAIGYTGPHLHDTTLVITADVERLDPPAESLDSILRRLGGQGC